ncbi:sensor histidine kinase [Flagellimonas sp.]|uniref:sensor histidine kinase n=1 Tax=Flagellimonas sp. TaxID=2058762 RepID=UPI003F49DAA4
MRKHLLIVVLGFTLGALFYVYHNVNEHINFWGVLLNGSLGIGICYVFDVVNRFLNKAIDWKKYTGIRLLTGVLVHMILGMGILYLGLKSYEFIDSNRSFFSNRDEMVFVKMGVLLFCVVLVYNIIYFAFYSYQQYVHGQLLTSQISRRQTGLQLAALKSQLSPHFLFNCLNALSSLIPKDIESAEKFIRSLASSYNYPLATYKNTLVKVSEEMEFVRSYFFLMKTRFQEQITLVSDIPQSVLDTKIPPLTLQMLVENAMKHNTADSGNPLQIEIKVENDFLEVTNNITKKRTNVASTKIGLSNIEARYQLLAKKGVVIQKGSADFRVKLPILP